MSIKQEIENWDGKSSSDIGAIYNRYANEDYFVTSLIELFRLKELQKGATWLIKHHFENKKKLNINEVAAIYKLAPKVESWEAKLHILQSISYMPIGEAEKNSVELFLRNCLVDKNKFVRAWTYNGFYEMSLQYPENKSGHSLFVLIKSNC
ncbi:MAG: hypothetical protein ABW170_22900 [Candidatus Thiodiazotropha sp. L084R]